MYRPRYSAGAAPAQRAAVQTMQPSKLDPPPPSIRPHNDHTLKFDFEPEMEQKLEKEKQKQLRTADPRFKTVVCVHWVSGLCMKGEKCEFLHEMDMDRMPECRLGQRCQEKMCPFKHVKDEERALCNNYNLGFCQHGAACRYQHKKRGPDQLPVICDFAQVSTQPMMMANRGFAAAQTTTMTPSAAAAAAANGQRRLNYRTALCQTFSQTGTCNYGENCDFAHSVEEMQHNLSLRTRNSAPIQSTQQQSLPQQRTNQPKRYTASDLDRIVISLRDWQHEDIDRVYLEPMRFPRPRDVPALPDETVGSADTQPSSRYFLCRTLDFEPLAASLRFDKWMMHSSVAAKINMAMQQRAKQVFLFFAVNDQECFAGVARVTNAFTAPVREECKPQTQETMVCTVEWLRMCELSFKKTAYITAVDPHVQRELPIAMGIEGQELPPSVGHVLMRMVYYEQETGADPAFFKADKSRLLDSHPLGPAPQVSQAFATSPLVATELGGGPLVAQFAIEVKQPGFVFQVLTPELLHDYMTTWRMGINEDEDVKIGTMFILYTPFDGKLYGVFEAMSRAERRWDATCAAPYQFKFRWLMPCDPIQDNSIATFRQRRLGQYSKEDLQNFVNLFATKARRGDALPPLKSPVIEQLEKGIAPAVDLRRGMTVGEVQQVGPGQWKQSCLFNYDFSPKFRAPNRLIGKSGINMKQIQERSGATRARVLAGDEAPHEGVMEMVFEAATRESLEEAFRLGQELFQDVLKQWDEYQKKGMEMDAAPPVQPAQPAQPVTQQYPPRGGAPPPSRGGGYVPRGGAQYAPRGGGFVPRGGGGSAPSSSTRGGATQQPPSSSPQSAPAPAAAASAAPAAATERRNRSPDRNAGRGGRRRSPSNRRDRQSNDPPPRRRDRSRDRRRR